MRRTHTCPHNPLRFPPKRHSEQRAAKPGRAEDIEWQTQHSPLESVYATSGPVRRVSANPALHMLRPQPDPADWQVAEASGARLPARVLNFYWLAYILWASRLATWRVEGEAPRKGRTG